MLIYNITFHVDGELNLAPYLTYMHDVFYPTAANKEYVKNPRFTRLLTDIGEEMYGFSFSFEVDDVKAMKKWKQEMVIKLRKILMMLLVARLSRSLQRCST